MARIKKEYYEVVCDICEERADGHWHSEEYLNGEVIAEYYCPIDLCKDHMELFSDEFDDYREERYSKRSDEDKTGLIIEMKEYIDTYSD